MAENEGLEVPVGITLNRLTQQLAAAEQRMVRTAQRSERAFQQSNRHISRGFNSVNRASSAVAGGGLRQLALQLNQVGQQGAVTGDYMRALAVQMPDILLAFGTFGALIGVAAGALTPLITGLISGEKEASALADRLKGMKGAIDALKSATESYTTDGIEELIEKYGELNEQIDKLIERQVKVAGNEAAAAAREAVAAVSEAVKGGDLFNAIKNDLAAALDVQLQGNIPSIEQFQAVIDETAGHIEALHRAIGDMGAAETFEAQAEAMDRILSILEKTNQDTDDLYNGVASAAAAMREMAHRTEETEDAMEGVAATTASAAGHAGELADRLEAARLAAQEMARRKVGAIGLGEDFTQLPGEGAVLAVEEQRIAALREQWREYRRERDKEPPAEKKARGSRADPLEADAKLVIEETLTATQRYQQEQEKLNRLLREGKISTDQWRIATGRLGDEFDGTAALAQAAGDALRGAFDGIFDDPQRALENFAKSLAELALQTALFRGLAGALPGTFGADGAIPLVAGARASGGPVSSGRTYLVGERGPELIVPRSAGTVLTAGQTAGLAGGGTEVNIYGAPAGTTAERSRGPDGREIIDVQVGRGLAQGNQDGSMRSRFGVRPQTVRR